MARAHRDRDTGALFRSGASSLMNLNADEGPGGPNHDVHIKLKLSSTLLRAYVEHAGPRRLCQWLTASYPGGFLAQRGTAVTGRMRGIESPASGIMIAMKRATPRLPGIGGETCW